MEKTGLKLQSAQEGIIRNYIHISIISTLSMFLSVILLIPALINSDYLLGFYGFSIIVLSPVFICYAFSLAIDENIVYSNNYTYVLKSFILIYLIFNILLSFGFGSIVAYGLTGLPSHDERVYIYFFMFLGFIILPLLNAFALKYLYRIGKLSKSNVNDINYSENNALSDIDVNSIKKNITFKIYINTLLRNNRIYFVLYVFMIQLLTIFAHRYSRIFYTVIFLVIVTSAIMWGAVLFNTRFNSCKLKIDSCEAKKLYYVIGSLVYLILSFLYVIKTTDVILYSYKVLVEIFAVYFSRAFQKRKEACQSDSNNKVDVEVFIKANNKRSKRIKMSAIHYLYIIYSIIALLLANIIIVLFNKEVITEIIPSVNIIELEIIVLVASPLIISILAYMYNAYSPTVENQALLNLFKAQAAAFFVSICFLIFMATSGKTISTTIAMLDIAMIVIFNAFAFKRLKKDANLQRNIQKANEEY